MSDFRIDSKELIDYTLRLQKINSIALPIAVQNALNSVARTTKMKTLKETTEQMFDVKKKSFFKANSGYKPYNAKQLNYNLNRIKAEVMILKSPKSNEKATEQVAHQPYAKSIDRSVNPLGNKPQKKNVIDLLSKKPEIIESSLFEGGLSGNEAHTYIKKVSRANKRGSSLIIRNSSGTGSVHRVKQIKKRKPTKSNPNRFAIKLENIASYRKSGKVKLRKKAPFLSNALDKSAKRNLNNEFIKQAERQFKIALNK